LFFSFFQSTFSIVGKLTALFKAQTFCNVTKSWRLNSSSKLTIVLNTKWRECTFDAKGALKMRFWLFDLYLGSKLLYNIIHETSWNSSIHIMKSQIPHFIFFIYLLQLKEVRIGSSARTWRIGTWDIELRGVQA